MKYSSTINAFAESITILLMECVGSVRRVVFMLGKYSHVFALMAISTSKVNVFLNVCPIKNIILKIKSAFPNVNNLLRFGKMEYANAHKASSGISQITYAIRSVVHSK